MASGIKIKNQNNFLKPIGTILRRFHLLIFFVFIVGCLAATVLLLNQTLARNENDGYTSSISAGSINQPALEQVQALHPSSQPALTPENPEGRTNPFSE
ncbi:MAG: hypothetical protein WAR37_01710 [Candidatus Microsaccharimonas sp.]